ncbi:cobalamin-binding protein [Thalassotalea profundi]|uniref:Cobalamin-binding protein n=1 Tax=Thalassotalea profundi TaxID=2036687 RepID=A0ABQ3ISV9_9GAMM|nr:cobalamin-binding protein [Thalassotalea profundi]GHE91656.1 cobalamin-binding protein [Thalassotalea profundi]
MYHYFFTYTKTLLLAVVFFLSLSKQAGAEQLNSQQHLPRIIALAPHIVEMLYEVGAGDLIIGTTDHADFPEQAKEIPRVGNYAKLSIEQILSLDPDVIIAWRTGNPSDDLARLEKMGIKIVYSEPEYLEDVAREIQIFAKIAGAERQGKVVADSYLKKLAKIRAQYQYKSPIKVFFEMWSRPLTTVANNAWPQQQLAICAGENPFIQSATDYPQINVELVVLKSPEIIIQPTSEGHNNSDTVNWRQWPTIPAVKTNAFITPNADKMYRMTSRVLDELTLLCQSIDQYRKGKVE